jgi:hypothetical protein
MALSRLTFRGCWFGAWLGVSACAAAPPPAPSRPVSASRPAPRELADAPFAQVSADSQFVRFSLPDVRGWKRLREDTWFTVQHSQSHSRLEFKLWKQGELVDAADCEAQALLWKPELARPKQPPLETQSGEWPPGYRGHVTAYAVAQGDDSVQGTVYAASALLRECFVLRFVSEASGLGSREVVAERLAVVVNEVLPSLRRVAVDERVRRERRE